MVGFGELWVPATVPSLQPNTNLVSEIAMTSANRRLIFLILSLLLVISGPVLAVSQTSTAETDMVMSGCGSTMVDQDLNADAGPQGKSDCPKIVDMVCLGAGGMNQCAVTFAILAATLQGIGATLSQPMLAGPGSHYQNPHLASVTPPPENHS